MSSVVQTRSPVEQEIDIEALLAPIAGDNPAGQNLQYAGLYDDIREARREDENLDQGDWKRERKVADWPRVVNLATDALTYRTKDIQVGAWLTEALVKLHGFVGLCEGFRLMRGLLDGYWETLYPEVDEDDLEARANALSWMDRPLILPKAIKEAAISRSETGVVFSYLQFEQAREFDIPEQLEDLDYEERRKVDAMRIRATEEGRVTTEQWRIAKAGTGRAFYEETYALLNQCSDELKALDQMIDLKFGRYAPGLGAFSNSLDEIRTFIERIVKEKRILEPDAISQFSAEDDGLQGLTVNDRTLILSTGPIQTRQDALRWLAEVADYFRRNEPHSPVSYLVQRAIKWGQMPLESWLQDVIKNDGVLDQLRETLGLGSTSVRSDQDGS